MSLTSGQLARVNWLLYDCEDEDAFIAEMARTESSEELHEFARQFNWDCECSELKEVLRHPLCDRGTALMIYWLAAPVYYDRYSDSDDVPDEDRDGYRFVNDVRSMLVDDRFQYNKISFDPSSVWTVGERRRIMKGCGIPPELTAPNCTSVRIGTKQGFLF